MSHITQVIVTIKTGNAPGADADGPVYLGPGPREYRLDKNGNQFKKGATDEFILGNLDPAGQGNVKNPKENDPRNPITLEVTELEKAPYAVYIAYESGIKWFVKDVQVRVQGPSLDETFQVRDTINAPGIWLGQEFGKFLYLQYD